MKGTRIANAFRNTRLHYLLAWFFEKFQMEGFTLSYSQCGDDLIIRMLLGKTQRPGFYVDIGCNQPIQLSNTFKLYLKGWQGICVDGNETLIRKYRRIRKRDICLQAVVSDEKREVTFFQDDERPSLSSIDPDYGNELRSGSGNLREIKMQSTTLRDILETHLGGRKIDLLCVDVENHDIEVLKGNDFDRFRPQILCIEFNGILTTLEGSDIHIFLISKGYEPVAFSTPNAFYCDRR